MKVEEFHKQLAALLAERDALAAEIERLRAEVEVWKASFEQAASGHAMYAERTEQLAKVLAAIRDVLAKEEIQ